MPYYNFNSFKDACSNDQNNVIPIYDVLNDADKIFNLRTKKQLLDFISNDGLEDLQLQITKIWEKNPDKANPIMVDSYEFKTMSMRGYIAFMFNSKTKKWLIKSFHLSKNNDNSIMLSAFQKAGYTILESKNGK
jgi:hypothetical protein